MNTAANLQNAKSVKENGDMVLEAWAMKENFTVGL
jgi:hypothetical protein